MRVFKILGLVVGGLVALVALALVAIYLFVDPNDYKDRISAAVKDATGRELSLPGKLRLSLFPWVAIETGEASLGNPAGFGKEPFLTLKSAKMSVKLMPLLKKQLEVGRIEVDGLDLRLKQDARGKGNWEEWGAGKTPDAPDAAGNATPPIDLAGISITNSRIAFEDMVADKVALTIGHVAPGVAFPVSLKADLVTAPKAKPLPLELAGVLALDVEKQRYQFTDLKLNGSVQPAGAPKALAWYFATPKADLDLAAQTLAETQFTAEVGDAELKGSVAGQKLIDAPALAGRFELAEASPRELLPQFGIAPPATRDSDVLQAFSAKGKWAWQGKVARLTDLALTLDDSKLTGRFAYDTGNSGMDFALALDAINLDRYQPPPTAPDAASEPIELPVDFLKPLRAKGSFTVGDIRVGGAKLSQFSAGISIANAVARFAPLKAQLYGGSYNGDIGLDMRQAAPRLTMDEHMAGIDIRALMKDYVDSERLSGRGNLDMKLAGTGRSGDALLKTLDGNIALNLQDGAVEGIDVWYAIAEAQSLIKKRQLSGATNTKRTVFETFQASASVADGVATTNDLAIASQLLRITGKGSSNLVTQALDYSITATVLKAPAGADEGIAELARASIPVRITGTMTEPKIRPDLAGLVKERVKQEVQQKVDEKKEEVEQKVKEKVKDKLKGLFGKKEEPAG